MLSAVSRRARQGPGAIPAAGPRKAKALPALSSVQPVVSTGAQSVRLTSEQKAKIEEKRGEALRRKMKKQRQKQAVLPQMPGEDEDPFGFGFSLG